MCHLRGNNYPLIEKQDPADHKENTCTQCQKPDRQEHENKEPHWSQKRQ